MENLFQQYNLDKFKIKKPRKNEDRLKLIERLSEISGWAKKSIYFQTIKFPDKWLYDIIQYCEHYSNPKLRNKKLSEFIILSRIELVKKRMGDYPKKSELEMMKGLENKLSKLKVD
jgi:hypothetical protein